MTNGAKSKVIEDEKGTGVWGGLAPIIEVRISGPPGSGTLRGVDTVYLAEGLVELSLVRCSGSAMVPRKVIEDLEGAGVWGGLAPIIKRPAKELVGLGLLNFNNYTLRMA